MFGSFRTLGYDISNLEFVSDFVIRNCKFCRHKKLTRPGLNQSRPLWGRIFIWCVSYVQADPGFHKPRAPSDRTFLMTAATRGRPQGGHVCRTNRTGGILLNAHSGHRHSYLEAFRELVMKLTELYNKRHSLRGTSPYHALRFPSIFLFDHLAAAVL